MDANVRKWLRQLGACDLAIDEVCNFDGTPQEYWDQCPHGGWMAWLLAHTSCDRQRLLTATLKCVCLYGDTLNQPMQDRRVLRLLHVAAEVLIWPEAAFWALSTLEADYGQTVDCAAIIRSYFPEVPGPIPMP